MTGTDGLLNMLSADIHPRFSKWTTWKDRRVLGMTCKRLWYDWKEVKMMEIATGTAILKAIRSVGVAPAIVRLSFAGQDPATRAWKQRTHSERGIAIDAIQPETLEWLMRMRPKGVEFLDFRDGPFIGDKETKIQEAAFENSNLNSLLRTIRIISLEWEWQPAWVAVIRPPLYTTDILEYTRRTEGHYVASFMDMIASYMCNRGATVSDKSTTQNFCQHECRMRGKAHWRNGPNTWGDPISSRAQPFERTWTQRKEREGSRTTNIILMDPPSTDLLPVAMARALDLEGLICENRYNTVPYGHSRPNWPPKNRMRMQQWDCTREFHRWGRDEVKPGVYTSNAGLLYTSAYEQPTDKGNQGCPQRKTERCDTCKEMISTCDDSECQDCYQLQTVEKKRDHPSTIGVGKYGDESASIRRTSPSNPFEGPSYVSDGSETRRKKHALQRCATFMALAAKWYKETSQRKRKYTDNDASHHKWAERSEKGDMTILNLRETIQAEDLVFFARAMAEPKGTGTKNAWTRQLNNWEDATACWKSRSAHIVPFNVRHSNSVLDKAFRELVIIFHRPDGHQCRWFINYDCRSWIWTNEPHTRTLPNEGIVGPVSDAITAYTREEWYKMEKFVDKYGKE